MKNPLENLHQTLGIGAVLALILLFVGKPTFDQVFWTGLFRWAHVISGVLWIGILYYFNFVQMPSMPKIPDEQKPAKDGTVEAWGRSSSNPVGGWYGLKKGLRGRFGMYIPPLMEHLGKAEVEHNARGNRMRAI